MLTAISTSNRMISSPELLLMGRNTETRYSIVSSAMNCFTLFPFVTEYKYLGNDFFSTEKSAEITHRRRTQFYWNEIATRDINKSMNQLNEIRKLGENWNGYGASRFEESLIKKVEIIVNGLRYQPFISPTARDSIQMEYENDAGDYLEFEVFDSDEIKMFFYSKDGDSKKKIIKSETINEAVCEFYGRKI